MAGARRGIWRLAGAALLAVLLVAGCSVLAAEQPRPPATTAAAPPRLPAAPPARPGPVLAVTDEPAARLVRLDPRSLRRLPGPALRLPADLGSFGFSADRSTLVLAGNQQPTLFVVDVGGMRLLGQVPLGATGTASWLGWLGPRRVAVVADTGGGALDLLLVDPLARQVLAHQRLPGALSGASGGHGRAVLLLTPADAVGPARLAVVDGRGGVRTVGLPGVTAGFQPPAQEGEDAVGRQRGAGLAVDAAGGRAFVVSAGAPVTEVDLASLHVGDHDLGRRPAALRRLARWLVPPAEAKLLRGPYRQACWLGDGLLAVWGSDARVGRDAAGQLQGRELPSGLQLLDTRRWTAWPLQPSASTAGWQDGRLLAFGGARTEQGQARTGLTVYGPGDRRPRQLLRDRVVVEAHGNGALAYVGLASGDQGQTASAVVDLDAGRVLARLAAPLPYLLLGADWGC